MKLISFLGPNGAGKTTIGKKLSLENSGIRYICAGDLLRTEIKNKTPFGLEYEKAMANGEMAPVEKMNELLYNEIERVKIEKGDLIIVDGFPRNKGQLEFAIKNVAIDMCI